jgi:hypothetical protein
MPCYIHFIKYPLPAPKGGRNTENHILAEDEYMRVLRLNRPKNNSVDDIDYVFAGQLASKDNNVVVGYGKKNPNIARKYVILVFTYLNIFKESLERLIKVKCTSTKDLFFFVQVDFNVHPNFK